MFGKKGQVSTEYLLITGFILVAVTIIFSYSYISNNENIKVSQANTALDRMVNAADLVYALGPENTQFVEIELPVGTKVIRDITLCNNGTQDHNPDCGIDGVKLGALEVTVELIGGNSTITGGAKAELELDVPDPVTATGGRQNVKVYWCESKICFKRA